MFENGERYMPRLHKMLDMNLSSKSFIAHDTYCDDRPAVSYNNYTFDV